MTYEDYIKKLAELKLKAENSIVSKLPAIEKQAYQLLLDYIDDNVDTKDGQLVANDKAAKALQNFSDFYLSALADIAEYKGSVSGYLKNLKSISTLITDFQKSEGIDVSKANIGAVQEIVVSELIDRYTENGLNDGFVQPLRQLLYNNITAGMNKKQAMQFLRDYISSGKDTSGKLHQYIEQTAQQGVDSYSGAINTRIMQTFSIDSYIMSGSLIKTSSPQCRYCINKLGGIIDRDDWPSIEKIAEENGLIDGTNFENLPVNKMHWGCRHEFSPIILTQAQRAKILSSPTNE